MNFNPYQNQNMYGFNRGYQQPQQPSALGMSGRVVTNVEEAKAMPLDYYDGTPSYYPSPAESKIYVKYINGMGLPAFDTYVKMVDNTPTMETRIQRLENILKELGYDDKSNAANAINEGQR